MSSNAPAENEKTTVNISKFNLNAFVPRKPFFSYTATEPFQPCSTSKTEYIVYPSDTAIGLDDRLLRSLQKLISRNSYTIKTGPGLFFNQKGPTDGVGSDQIYIDCQPVGHSENEEIVITDSGSSADKITTENIMQNKYFQMFLGCIVFLVLIYVVKLLVYSYKPATDALNAATTGAKNVITGK